MKTNLLNHACILTVSSLKQGRLVEKIMLWKKLMMKLSCLYLEKKHLFPPSIRVLSSSPGSCSPQDSLWRPHRGSLIRTLIIKTEALPQQSHSLTQKPNSHEDSRTLDGPRALINQLNNSPKNQDGRPLIFPFHHTLGTSVIKPNKLGKQLMPCVLDGLYSHGLSLKMEF